MPSELLALGHAQPKPCSALDHVSPMLVLGQAFLGLVLDGAMATCLLATARSPYVDALGIPEVLLQMARRMV